MNLVESVRNSGPARFVGEAGKLFWDKPYEAGNVLKATVWGLKTTGQQFPADLVDIVDKSMKVYYDTIATKDIYKNTKAHLPAIAYKTFEAVGSATRLLLKLKVLKLGAYATPVGAVFLANDFYCSSSMVISKGADLLNRRARIKKYEEKVRQHPFLTLSDMNVKQGQKLDRLKADTTNIEKYEAKLTRYENLSLEQLGQEKQAKLDKARRSPITNNVVDIAFHVSLLAIFTLMGAGLAGVAVGGSAMVIAGGFAATFGLIKVGLKVYSLMPNALAPAAAT